MSFFPHLFRTKFEKYLRQNLGFYPINSAIYKTALTPPVANSQNNYQRLEFLGDAVLGLIVSSYLFMLYPSKDEGFLTEMRSKIVNKIQLADIAKKIQLYNIIEYVNIQSNLNSIEFNAGLLADIFEALVGAIYIDKGFDFTKKWLEQKVIQKYLNLKAIEQIEVNVKNILQSWAQKNSKTVEYITIENNKSTQFIIHCLVDKVFVAEGVANNKKIASILAAEKAKKILEI